MRRARPWSWALPTWPWPRAMWRKARRTDDGSHDGIDLGMRGDLLQRVWRLQHFGRQPIAAQLFSQQLRVWRAGHDGVAGLEFGALAQHQVHLRGRAECKDLVVLAVARHHVQRIGTDGARGAQDGDFLLHECAKEESIMASGRVGSRASTRSSTPPWPGSRPLLSLTPTLRLTRDSTRSPTTLIAAMNTTASSRNQAPRANSNQ